MSAGSAPSGFVRFVAWWTALVLVMAMVGLAVIPSTSAGASEPPTIRVLINHLSFDPDSVRVPVGTTVVWRNDETDGTTHSVSGGPLSSPDLTPGLVYPYTFNAPGTYVYH